MSAPDSGDDIYASAEARVGIVLNDKWTLEKLLGVGAMGAVYKGLHRNGATGAIKVLHMTLAREPQLRERFLREGYAANRVGHPGAVKVLDDDTVTSGPCEGSAYLVMELLIGESLQDRLTREEPVGEREFLLVASAVLAVLEKAHANGVVHRDLKPENIFLLAEDAIFDDGSLGSIRIPGRPRVKVLDYGLARLLDAASNTHHGMALGTPSFMSPEQASGNNDDLDGRTDLFSLAASGFRLVAGRRVHEGAQHVVVQVANMATLPAPKIKSVAPQVTLPFARVIDRALLFKREDRYADAAEMRADVEKALVEIEQIARNPTLLDIPEVPLPPSASVKVPPPSSIKVPAANEGATNASDAPAIASAASKAPPATPSEPETEPVIATEAEKEPDHAVPEKAQRSSGAVAWILVLGLLGAVGTAAWAMQRNPGDPVMNVPEASVSAVASSDALDASINAASVASATLDALQDAGDAAVSDDDDDDDDGAAPEIVIELDASDNSIRVPPVTSAQRPRPTSSGKPNGKPFHPPPKASQKPPPKKPPPPHHWW